MRSLCLASLLVVLDALACSGPRENDLFAKDGTDLGASLGPGGSSHANAGTGSGNGAQAGTGQVVMVAGGGADGGGSGGPTAGSLGSAGSQGGDDKLGRPPVIERCDMLDRATTNDENGHCYRANMDKLTFSGARDTCVTWGGHLVTVDSKTEDAFVHALLQAEHWLGATDGRADGMEGVGPYSWVNAEPWDYSRWEGGQPNAVATNCPNENGGANCYEHCAYQDDSGGWNDRACWHAIASICEWEPLAEAQ